MVYDIFFVLCIVFGAFFVLNLMIAVQFNYLNTAFNEIDKKKELEQKKQKQELAETMINN